MFLDHSSSRNQVSNSSFLVFKSKCPRTNIQVQVSKEANEPNYCKPTLKRGQVTHQKRLKALPHKASNFSNTRSQSQAISTMHTSPAPLVPDRIPYQESSLSPEWTHAITTLMGHPLSSEQGKYIQKWILYHAIHDPTNV